MTALARTPVLPEAVPEGELSAPKAAKIGDWVLTIARAGRPAPRRRAAGPARSSSGSAFARPPSFPAYALRQGPESLTDGFRLLAQTRTSSRLKAQAPFEGSLRPMSRPTRGPLDQRQALRRRQALRQRQELARESRGILWRQLPRMRNAPIEACRKADGVHDYPLTAVRLGRFFGLLSIAVVEAGRA